MKPVTARWVAHSLILAGIFLVAIWPLHPLALSRWYAADGARHLQQMQRDTGAASEAQYALAIQAGQSFQTALRWDPLNARAYDGLAAIYLAWGDADSAARALARACVLAPRDVALLLRLGDAFRAAGQPEQAADAYTRALALHPNNAAASQALEALKAATP